jgi:hypothetical protein
MNDLERPQLEAIVIEEILYSLHKIDLEYWPLIAGFEYPRFIPPPIPVPPKRRLQFLKLLQQYAESLFKTEADYYDPFRSDGRYPAWLSRLSDRTAVQVRTAVDKVEQGFTDASLWFQGATYLDIDHAVRQTLWDLMNHYIQRDAGPHSHVETVDKGEAAAPSSVALNPAGQRERIDNFIVEMSKHGLKVKRKDIWRVAGYKNPTEFERFQRGDGRNKSASSAFNRVLGLSSEDFSRLIKKP